MNVIVKAEAEHETRGDVYLFHCPGCNGKHQVVVGPGMWGFNGDLERPTLEGSVLVYSHETLTPGGHAAIERGETLTDEHRTTTPRCHSFIRDGHIEYLSDTTHELSGQTVPMGPVH